MNAKIRAKKLVSSPQEVALMNERAAIAKEIGLHAIHKMGREELLKLQERLGLGSVWGFVLFPEDWMPPGNLKQLCARRLDITKGLKGLHVGTADQDLAIRTVTAAVLLCFASPIYNARYVQYLKPSSIVSVGIKVLRLVRQALALPVRVDGKLLARLPMPERRDHRRKDRDHIEIERFTRFAERGLWSDIPVQDSSLPSPSTPAGSPIQRTLQARKRVYLPLSDDFLAAAGFRVVWLVETLGPSLLLCGRVINQIRMDYPLDHDLYNQNKWNRSKLSQAFLEKFQWTAPDGSAIEKPPFSLDFSGMGKGGKFSWPPRTMAQTRMLIRILQAAHLFIFLISTGGRISEALSLQPGCVTESPDGVALANGRTYKLSVSIDGRARDWPLPAIAVRALQQQEELATFATFNDQDDNQDKEEDAGEEDNVENKEDNSDGIDVDSFDLHEDDGSIEEVALPVSLQSIWTREGGRGEILTGGYNAYLKRLVEVFGLAEELGEGKMHAHRFRKSTARLIALSILGAPKILMDLFGHKQIGMTLHYILSDPTIRSEMLEVAQAQTIMLAKTAIVSIDEAGGPAAVKVKAAVEAVRFRMGEDFGDTTIEELAETLTDNGRNWQLVRPGILCTKGAQVAGACTPSTAMPEPSRCRAKCDHRLELSFLRDDVDKSVQFAVTQVELALNSNDPMKAEMWRGQILTNINRFESVRSKWHTHPIIKEILHA